MTHEMLSKKAWITGACLMLAGVVVAFALGVSNGVADESGAASQGEASVVAQDSIEAEAEAEVAELPASVIPEVYAVLGERGDDEIAAIVDANKVCAACHVKEGTSMGYGPDDAQEPADEEVAEDAVEEAAEVPVCLVQLHVDTVLSCNDCHVDTEKLDTIHGNLGTKKPASRLRQTKVLDDVCLTCHVAREDLAKLTADAGVYMEDEKGTQVNPHDLPQGIKDHEGLECRDCHIAHVPTAVVTDAQGTCLSCHHSGVFECGTCH
ncbi:MAG: hypothetical protein E7211_19620 [Clostridium lundense]|nr:hypothetical protein [Clostridium lundense]